MRALLSGVIAMVEAVAVALATLVAIAFASLLVWWLMFDLTAEPLSVLQVAGGVWLLAHFVPYGFHLSAEAMQALGFAPEPLSFVISLVPLGITLVTIAFASRAGWRFGNRGGAGVAGTLGGALGFGAVTGLTCTLMVDPVMPGWGAALTGGAVYGAASLVAYLIRASRERHAWWQRFWTRVDAAFQHAEFWRSPPPQGNASRNSASAHVIRHGLGAAVRLGVMLLTGFLALAAVGVTAAVLLGYAQMVAASQALQLGVWGAVLVFALQLLLLPLCIVWAGAWLTGAGFAIGTGTSVSPFGALLGPIPAVPIFAAVPEGWGDFGVLAPLLVTVVGFTVGVLYGRNAQRAGSSAVSIVTTTVLGSVTAGLGVALLGWAASGALGPGRLETVGIEPWIAAGLAASELGIGAALGAYVGSATVGRVTRAVRWVFPGQAVHNWSRDIDVTAEHELYGDTGVDGTGIGETGVKRVMHAGIDTDEQVTEPLEPFDATWGGAEADPPPPIALPVHDGYENNGAEFGAAEHSGAEFEAGDSEVTEGAATSRLRRKEPELFDQVAAAGAEEDAAKEPGATVPDTPADELLEAFAWDAPQPPEEEPKKRNWRFPGRKG